MAKPPAAKPGPSAHTAEGSGFRLLTPLNVMFLAVPVAVAIKFSGASDRCGCSSPPGSGIIPLAGYMGKATEALAERLGAAAGGLLNATFGNAAELIIALMILSPRPPNSTRSSRRRSPGRSSATSCSCSGWRSWSAGCGSRRQTFNRTNAGVGATLLAIAAAGLLVPTLFFYLSPRRPGPGEAAAVRWLT